MFQESIDVQSMTANRSQGYLIIGSGMAVHSFESLHEIRDAPTEEAKKTIAAKVFKESRDLDTHIRNALKKLGSAERTKALLDLESLPEFKRGHPTVEVSHTTNFMKVILVY